MGSGGEETTDLSARLVSWLHSMMASLLRRVAGLGKMGQEEAI